MSMIVQNYRDVTGKPSHLGTFDLYFPAWQMTMHELKLMKTSKGHMFINFPSRCEKLEDGKFKFHAYISFSKDRNDLFQKSVKELLKEYTRIE